MLGHAYHFWRTRRQPSTVIVYAIAMSLVSRFHNGALALGRRPNFPLDPIRKRRTRIHSIGGSSRFIRVGNCPFLATALGTIERDDLYRVVLVIWRFLPRGSERT